MKTGQAQEWSKRGEGVIGIDRRSSTGKFQRRPSTARTIHGNPRRRSSKNYTTRALHAEFHGIFTIRRNKQNKQNNDCFSSPELFTSIGLGNDTN